MCLGGGRRRKGRGRGTTRKQSQRTRKKHKRGENGGRSSRDGEVVTSSEPKDLSSVPERGSHDDGVVAKLLVVVEDLGDRQDTYTHAYTSSP